MASKISDRQRKLVQDGAKGVASRWIGDPAEAAQEGARFRSAVKRFSGRESEKDLVREPDPQKRERERSIRAEQAATGMMSPPPTTFEEKTIKDWLGKMSLDELQKLSRLMEIAKQGKEGGKAAWSKVDQGLRQQAIHVEVHGGNVTVNTAPAYGPRPPSPNRSPENWGRHLAKIRNFING